MRSAGSRHKLHTRRSLARPPSLSHKRAQQREQESQYPKRKSPSGSLGTSAVGAFREDRIGRRGARTEQRVSAVRNATSTLPLFFQTNRTLPLPPEAAHGRVCALLSSCVRGLTSGAASHKSPQKPPRIQRRARASAHLGSGFTNRLKNLRMRRSAPHGMTPRDPSEAFSVVARARSSLCPAPELLKRELALSRTRQHRATNSAKDEILSCLK